METNRLYPVFLKASQLNILIIGGGKVALEKLTFLLKSSPDAKVSLLAKHFLPEIMELIVQYQLNYEERAYNSEVLEGKQLIIAATNDSAVNKQVVLDAKEVNILINVADVPDLCDFYLGGIVTKGAVKIAISTNGQSPTLAKRLRQFLEAVLPDDIALLADNLREYRSLLKTDLDIRVSRLNDLTQGLLSKTEN